MHQHERSFRRVQPSIQVYPLIFILVIECASLTGLHTHITEKTGFLSLSFCYLGSSLSTKSGPSYSGSEFSHTAGKAVFLHFRRLENRNQGLSQARVLRKLKDVDGCPLDLRKTWSLGRARNSGTFTLHFDIVNVNNV